MLHWGTFDTIGQHVFLRNFAAFVMSYFDALKVRTIRLDRLLRVNVITALTDSSCSYRLSGRLFILAILLSSLGVMQLHSLMYRVAWFLLWFDQVPLFYLVALATPIASKPVQCTDLVDASESCWGGKEKKMDYGSRIHDLSLVSVALCPLLSQWFSCLAQFHLRGRG